MHVFLKELIDLKKNGIEKDFVSQLLSISPNSMISFKFYVKTPFFNTFITLHLDKSHIYTVNVHSGPAGVGYGQIILKVVWVLLRPTTFNPHLVHP